MQTLTEIKALLAARGIRPKHRFGQNFLHDHNQLKKLIDAARVAPGEVVVEVGPGTGTLTETLVEAGARVIACEIDADMQAIVRERVGERITLVEGDCLDGKRALSPALLDAIGGRPFVLVANLPYGAASPLMAILATRHPTCRGQFVTVQKEVADRVRAKPNTRDYGPLTIILQRYCTVREIGVVPPGCFWPAPDVTSAMLAIEPRRDARDFEPAADVERFERFLHSVFSKRRKQLGSILGRDLAWPTGVRPEDRPEALTIEQLVELSRAVPDAPPFQGDATGEQ